MHHFSETDFIRTVASSKRFVDYRESFSDAMGLKIELEDNRGQSASTSLFSVEIVHPVPVSETRELRLRVQLFRLNEGPMSNFEDVARQMLHDGCSSAEICKAHQQFLKSPVFSPRQGDAIKCLTGIFAEQLSDHAQKLYLQSLDSEPVSVLKARRYILDNMQHALSLDEVAREAGVSSFHLCKTFKRHVGLTFTEFVNGARVEKAKRLLLKPRSRVTEVAYDVGFQSLSQFNRSFRKMTSLSPKEYRVKALAKLGGGFVAHAKVA